MQTLIVTYEQMQKMRHHVETEAPLEACGLLAGKDSRVEAVHEIRNQAQSPARFVMDSLEQWQAFEEIEFREMDLLAIYHSHPAGPATPSATDIAEAAYPVVNVVWSRANGEWRARGFRIENGQVTEVILQVV